MCVYLCVSCNGLVYHLGCIKCTVNREHHSRWTVFLTVFLETPFTISTWSSRLIIIWQRLLNKTSNGGTHSLPCTVLAHWIKWHTHILINSKQKAHYVSQKHKEQEWVSVCVCGVGILVDLGESNLPECLSKPSQTSSPTRNTARALRPRPAPGLVLLLVAINIQVIYTEYAIL